MVFPPRALAVAALALAACGSVAEPVAVSIPTAAPSVESTAMAAPTSEPSAHPVQREAPRATDTLEIDDLVVGTGALAEKGRRVRMSYVGRLLDGTEFDRTLRRPFEFQLGAGEVIAGWDRGIEGMRVGGKRRLVIPPDLGYGEHGAPPTIPPHATLVFDVELLEVL